MNTIPIVDVEDTTVSLDKELYSRLQQTAGQLATDLGFPVSVEQAIAFVWKKACVDFPNYMQHVNRRVDDPVVVPEPLSFTNDFGATAAIPAGMSARDVADAKALSNGSNKINAIKLVRDRTKCGLKDAKEFVEAHFKTNLPVVA